MTSLNLPPPTELYRENLYYQVKPLYNQDWLETLDPAAREYLPQHVFVLGYKSTSEMLKTVQEMYPKFKMDSLAVCLPGSPVPPSIREERQAQWLSWLNLHSFEERGKLLSALIFNRGLPAGVVDEYSFMEFCQSHDDFYQSLLENESEPDDDQSSCSSGSSDSSDGEERLCECCEDSFTPSHAHRFDGVCDSCVCGENGEPKPQHILSEAEMRKRVYEFRALGRPCP